MSEAKNILVTGAASGIGRRLTGDLAERGDWVLATDVDAEGLEDVSGEHVETMTLDVTEPGDWQAGIERVVDERGQIDMLVHAAAIAESGSIIEADPDTIARHVDINVKGTMFGTRYVGAAMVEQGFGHLINFGSLASLTPVPGLGIYAATKFSVRGLSLAAAQELREQGVDVTVVMPANVDTPLLRSVTESDSMDIALAGALLTVDDISEAFFERALPDRPLEVTIPRSSGALTRLATVAPELFHTLRPILEKIGGANLESYRQQHEE